MNITKNIAKNVDNQSQEAYNKSIRWFLREETTLAAASDDKGERTAHFIRERFDRMSKHMTSITPRELRRFIDKEAAAGAPITGLDIRGIAVDIMTRRGMHPSSFNSICQAYERLLADNLVTVEYAKVRTTTEEERATHLETEVERHRTRAALKRRGQIRREAKRRRAHAVRQHQLQVA